ncbi:Fibrinogen-like protein A [Holothuria leucospilota]|uniref:Fibrinogen-like protein A n=1 Tax=Holothuria leucospilota TaxID=206669 RepID=A0A9Q1H560_HOLLE|nr:Fibrinogen-like protein A [Holothuria leucospilota]
MGHPSWYITQILVLCWTAGIFRAQQLSNEHGNSHVTAPMYFFYQRPEYPRDCQEVQVQCQSNNSSGVYVIKPDGYPEPFEVYCDNANPQAWTVIQRRVDGFIDFNRDWESYKLGFGFLWHEYWIGNEKLAYLTSQMEYELRIDMTISNGSTFYVSYNLFRISDEFSGYKLTSGQYFGNADTFITWCSNNVGYGNCSCQRSCEDPSSCLDTCDDSVQCICPENYYVKQAVCVPQEECGCFVSGVGIIPEGGFYVSAGCTRRAVCNNGHLTWDGTYRCDSDAACEEKENIRQCYCNPGYVGDGQSCTMATDCFDIYNAGMNVNGVYLVKPTSWPGSAFEVYCNMSDGGGWTVFQHREDGTVDFYRNWNAYKAGFGSADHEYWLGNDKIYYLTNQKRYTIRVDLVNRYGLPYYAKYDYFRISSESDLYRLTEVGAYSGNADDGSHSNPAGYALSYHRGKPFSTYDRDNDDYYSYNCASYWHGAWWYHSCYYSHLNGNYNEQSVDDNSVSWHYLPGSIRYIKYTEMKVRPL